MHLCAFPIFLGKSKKDIARRCVTLRIYTYNEIIMLKAIHEIPTNKMM